MSKVVNAPPCPFWRAATVDQRHIDPNAPAPLKADEKNSIASAAEHLMYHGGFDRLKATAIAELLVVAANKGAFGKIKALFTQTFVPNELSGGLLDKELDTGMLRHVDTSGVENVGVFSEKHHEKMFASGNASDYQVGGKPTRAMNAAQLQAFVDKNRDAIGAGKIHHLMAKFEMQNLLLEMFGRVSDSGEKVITKNDARVFFDNAIFPHARLGTEVSKLYPTERGAAIATGGADDAVERMQSMGTSGACPFMGGAAAAANPPEARAP